MAFVFPFSTCERPTGGWVAQPVSAAVNGLSTVVLATAAAVARTWPVRVAIASYAAFEAWHTFSHVRHLAGKTQVNVVHVLNYCMAFATLLAILYLSDTGLHPLAAAAIAAAAVIDLWVFFRVPGVWYILTGLGVFVVVVCSQWAKLPPRLRATLPVLLAAVVALGALIVNEAYNCDRMLAWAPLPYHAAIEVLGVVLFAATAWLILDWERAKFER